MALRHGEPRRILADGSFVGHHLREAFILHQLANALLDFLHQNGAVFYRPGLFGDRIVLDQNWALEAIYALFDRKKILPLLRGYGRFSRADLEALVWSGHTSEE